MGIVCAVPYTSDVEVCNKDLSLLESLAASSTFKVPNTLVSI